MAAVAQTTKKKEVTFAIDAHNYDEPLIEPEIREVKKGYALIINNLKFEGDLLERKGTERDDEALRESLTKFGFDVQPTLQDSAKDELEARVRCASTEAEGYDCVLVATLTHGNGGGTIWTSDSQVINVLDIMDPFLDNKKLDNVPKVFIFQACRGSKHDKGQRVCGQPESEGSGVTVSGSSVVHAGEEDSEHANLKGVAMPHPDKPEVLVAHSTVEDKVCYRNTETGTFYIQSLCKVLAEVSESSARHSRDLVRILTSANRQLAGETVRSEAGGSQPVKQTGSFTSSLTCRILLNVDQNGGAPQTAN